MKLAVTDACIFIELHNFPRLSSTFFNEAAAAALEILMPSILKDATIDLRIFSFNDSLFLTEFFVFITKALKGYENLKDPRASTGSTHQGMKYD